MDKINVFFAHPSGMSTQAIDKSSQELRALLKERSAKAGRNLRISVIPGRDDFKLHFKGDWSAWAQSVLTRKDSITLKRHYSMIITPEEQIGKATGEIIEKALELGRPVFLYDQGTLRKVTDIYLMDPDDWQGGFFLDFPEPAPPPGPPQLKLPFAQEAP